MCIQQSTLSDELILKNKFYFNGNYTGRKDEFEWYACGQEFDMNIFLKDVFVKKMKI